MQILFQFFFAFLFIVSNSNSQNHLPIEVIIPPLENYKYILFHSVLRETGPVLNSYFQRLSHRFNKSGQKLPSSRNIWKVLCKSFEHWVEYLNFLYQNDAENLEPPFQSSTIVAHRLFKILSPNIQDSFHKETRRICCLDENENLVSLKIIYSLLLSYITLLSVIFIHLSRRAATS